MVYLSKLFATKFHFLGISKTVGRKVEVRSSAKVTLMEFIQCLVGLFNSVFFTAMGLTFHPRGLDGLDFSGVK